MGLDIQSKNMCGVLNTGRYPIIPCFLFVCFDDAMRGKSASFYVNKGIRVNETISPMHHKSKQRRQKAWDDGITSSVKVPTQNYFHQQSINNSIGTHDGACPSDRASVIQDQRVSIIQLFSSRTLGIHLGHKE